MLIRQTSLVVQGEKRQFLIFWNELSVFASRARSSFDFSTFCTDLEMSAAVCIAVAAAAGNLLQGWDGATMAGAVIYIKKEFQWENDPTMEGLVVATSLLGSALITAFSGQLSDWLGRRGVLTLASFLFIISGLLMLWSPNVYFLLFGRLLDGFGIGLINTYVSVYISEMAPPEIRGLLTTLPQFTYSTGLFLAYCMVFGMSLIKSPNWRSMLGFFSIPSLVYCAVTIFYLPESPRWLVSKGRMLEARRVLQRLRGREDVSGEIALLVEGLGLSDDTTIEEYVIGPANEDEEEKGPEEEEIRLFGPEDGLSSVVARAIPEHVLGTISQQGSAIKQTVFAMSPTVALFDSLHEKASETGSKGSIFFPHIGSMLSMGGNQNKNEEWDEESLSREGDDYASHNISESEDNNLQSPLLSRQTTSFMTRPNSHGSKLNLRQDSISQDDKGENGESIGIGSGWQLAWKWKEDGNMRGSFKRIFLHEDGVSGSGRGSLVSIPGGGYATDGEFIKAAALVTQPALFTKELMDQHPVGPAMVHPSVAADKGPTWRDLMVPGVKNALIVGMGIQILQQFLGINVVLLYGPQILAQAGVGDLFANLGISSASASVLISATMTFLMLPCVAIAMRLMDVSGRRGLLLSTTPIITVTLSLLVIATTVNFGNTAKAVISSVSVITYGCVFAMGYGPIPNILCSEIFPTRVRGTCIAICGLACWGFNIIITYTLPGLLSTIGVPGVFGVFAVSSIIAYVFVYSRVPETKGMPLEVITEFFSVGAKQSAA